MSRIGETFRNLRTSNYSSSLPINLHAPFYFSNGPGPRPPLCSRRFGARLPEMKCGPQLHSKSRG